MKKMSEIQLKHIYKDYIEGQHAVADFNLDITDGEFIVLVGPSGCGKSTTLRMVAGLEDITSGELIIDGKLVNDIQPKNRDIAMVFQNYALYPHMTVAENMGFGLKMKNVSKAEIDKRVNESAELIGLTEYLDRLPKELSGGQRQRVALGRAIVRKPKVFLMDEPLSNLDAKLRVQTRAEISQLTRELGVTTLYVTHDQVEAMTMADRIVVMSMGKVQQVASPKEIYLNPANRFVAGFMGSPAMNFWNITVYDHGLEHNGQLLPAPVQVTRALINKGYNGQTICMGVRPEHIDLYEDASVENQNYAFSAKIKLSEMLGTEALIHFDLHGEHTVSKINSLEDFSRGEERKFAINFGFAYFFDKNTSQRIDIPNFGDFKNYL